MATKQFSTQNLDKRTPVLVGVASLHERHEDPEQLRDAIALMVDVAKKAVSDSKLNADQLNEIIVPQGLWSYQNPAAEVKQSLGAKNASTTLMRIGILQQASFSRAAQSIADGSAQAVLIVGAEAQYRQRRATKLGIELKDTPYPLATDTSADNDFAPDGDLILEAESERGLVFPVSMYAMIENAFCHKKGLNMSQRMNEIDDLWSVMSAVAEGNPDACYPQKLSREEVRAQPNMATPYTRSHVSQWNVNQASAFVLCSVELAEKFDVDPKQWVFPICSAEYNHMQPLSTRTEVGRSLPIESAAPKALDVAGLTPADIDYWDLYSCFPIAVRLQQEALGLTENVSPTVIGGMSFAGGPLNNYSFQAAAKMMSLLRQSKSYGVVSSISGIIHKYGIGVWSGTPPSAPYSNADMEPHPSSKQPCELLHGYNGEGVIGTSTLLYQGGKATQFIALVDVAEGKRVIGTSNDASIMAIAAAGDLIGTKVSVAEDYTLAIIP